ncbi:guanylate kinase [Spiroplasma endosymbiont of Aspidapion aeneum]|uniref:guanylate kinase n=1 Tax=Spiroplasma endosymbiont of Aspidapion aeneum TaxID=3066276 RepID=UPI00313F1C11
MKKGKIIIVSGPSGVGKGTVNKALLEEKDLKLVTSVSMTSRPSRPGEIDGVNYHFVSRETFEEHIKNNNFLEYVEFIGNYYGTLRQTVYETIIKGDNVVLEIDVVGANKIIRSEKSEDLVSIFLTPPNLKHLENRLRGRGTETEAIIRQRLNKALLEIPLKHNYQYAVILDTIENTISKIRDILLKENCLEEDYKNSYYYKMTSKIEKILKEKYMFFIDNWYDNIKSIGHNIDKNLNLFNYMRVLLAERIYKYILANTLFANVFRDEFIQKYVEKYILDFNFYSIDQSEFTESHDL